jgi:hypothetical protein
MSDDGNCFYICHANGQSWIELGQNGTIDLYSTNSVNVRTQGTLNLHADKDINMYAGGSIKVEGQRSAQVGRSCRHHHEQCPGNIHVWSNSELALEATVHWRCKAKLAVGMLAQV